MSVRAEASGSSRRYSVRGFEVSRVPENFEGVDECLPDQTAPDDGRLSPRDPPARVVKVNSLPQHKSL